uniref:Rho GTPase-activating protein 10 n=1 Tax=Paramormyrops kingsleyae TaxID=1676925 RepID=A0A3B3T6L2_9TELE
MGLQPLEFSDCYLDSPSFRERIRAHEAELDKTNRFIKELYKDGKNLINATKREYAPFCPKDAQILSGFQKSMVQSANESHISYESLQEFSMFLKNLEEQREMMMRNITETLMKPLEKFRKEQLGSAKEERKRYEKETEKYYSSLEKPLTLSARKKEQHLQEADLQVEQMKQHFQESSLEYVCKLQEIQERKKFDCVEPMLAFFQAVFTFYHQGYELAKDFDHYKKALQINIQNTRSRFEGTRSEVMELMRKFKECPKEHRQTSPISIEGYLYVQEKRPPPFGSSWVKRYCTFVKNQKILHMITFDHRSGGKIGETESVTLKSCLRKTTDVLDRRFCLDLEITDRPGVVLTVQTLSDDDRKFWMQAMGGKEPVSDDQLPSLIDAQLDDIGLSFVKNSIEAIEKRGINDQGLYRVVGVSSKVQKLLAAVTDEKSYSEVNLSTSEEWDVKTITSALKVFLRSLPEPLMTYGLYKEFIMLAKSGSPESRVQSIHALVHNLPEKNRAVLGLLMKHLARVAENSKQNLMTVANLGVVFGPTLMRPQEETVAAIMELKFQNIDVEILIEHHQKIFGDTPGGLPSKSLITPTRLSKKSSRQSRPLAVYNPQMGDIAVCTGMVLDAVSLGSDESVSSQSSTSGSPTEKTQNALGGSETNQEGQWLHPFIRVRHGVWSSELAELPPSPPPSIPGRKAKAVFPCEAEHDSELSFQVGAIFDDVIVSREPGWLEGVLEGRRGLIPENYVKML